MSHFNEHDSHYIKRIKDIPILSREEELNLTKKWQESQNSEAADRIINAHLKLVAKIANGYRGYGLPLNDLIAEGNIGMMQAMKHFDPDKGFRLSTYATWWIKASIQEYILQTWSIVKMSSSSTQKKLFFGLRKTRLAIQSAHEDELTPELINAIAEKLQVKPAEVEYMAQRLTKDSSLNLILGNSDDNQSEWIDWITDEKENQEVQVIQRDEIKKRKALFDKAMESLNERERQILIERRLCENPLTLEEIAEKYQISKERVRQIENNCILKLQKTIRTIVSPHPHHL